MRYKGKFVARVTMDIDVDANSLDILPREEIEKNIKNGSVFNHMKAVLQNDIGEDGTVEVESLVSEWRVEE